MSTDIVARFYFKTSHPPLDEIFCLIAQTFAKWPQAIGEFRGLRVLRDNGHTIAEEHKDCFSSENLCHASFDKRDPDYHLSTTSLFRCWRFSPAQPPEAGSVVIGLQSWGESWGKRNHEDRRVGGDAAVSVSVGPFIALTEQTADPRWQDINSRVDENLEALSGLLFRLIEALQPWSMKVFTDQGLYLPFNAHLAYYQDESAILDDMQLIEDIWERGLPEHNIAPLRSKRQDDMGLAFHHWRSSAQREFLWSELQSLLTPRPRPSIEDVRRVLNSGYFDTYTMPVGFTLLNFPHYINYFLDGFYRNVLVAGKTDEVLN